MTLTNMQSTAPSTALSAHLKELDEGFTLLPDFLSQAQLDGINALYDRWLGGHRGRNTFEGHATERLYALVARDPVFRDIIEDPRILELCDTLLLPNYLLTASQAIVIGSGETPQPWHTDDSCYSIPLVFAGTLLHRGGANRSTKGGDRTITGRAIS